MVVLREVPKVLAEGRMRRAYAGRRAPRQLCVVGFGLMQNMVGRFYTCRKRGPRTKFCTMHLMLEIVAGVELVTRQMWGAKPALPGAIPHVLERITIHHTGVLSNPKRSLEDKLRGLQAFSQREDKLASGKTKPAWPDIPYHFYISWDGRVGEGRELKFAGDTNTEYDPKGHLLIVVEGEFDQEKPTEAQMRSLENLLLLVAEQYGQRTKSLSAFVDLRGHMDFSTQTNCPGKALESELPRLRSWLRRSLREKGISLFATNSKLSDVCRNGR